MANKTKWLVNFVEFFLENFTVLLTIGFTGYIIYRQEIERNSLSTDELLTAILGVLGLLAISEVVERYRRLGSIEKSGKRTLSLLEARFTDRPSAIGFFQKTPSLDTYIVGADQIDMCGVSLTSTLNKQFSNLRERLKSGGNIRVLVVDPDSLALQMSALRSEDPDDVGYFSKRLETSFNDLGYLYKSWEEYQKLYSPSKVGSLSIRLISYAPSFGTISFDANRSNGVVFVEIYSHRSGYGSQPTFDLTLHRDGEWYKYFVEQFEQMWQDAKPWKPISQKSKAG